MASTSSTRRARRGAAALLAVVTASILVAACGGSSAASGSGGTSTNQLSMVPYARCIRAHGIPQYPDSGSVEQSGNTTGGGSATVAGHAIPETELLAAERRCAKDNPYVTDQPKFTPAQLARVQAAGLKASACIRAHGVPDYPDQKVEPGFDGRGLRYVVIGKAPKSFPRAAFAEASKVCSHLFGRP